MNVDELIQELQQIKELHPLAGRSLVTNTNGVTIKEVKQSKSNNASFDIPKIILKFEP